MHILIIDDNPEITENISLYLSSKGYDTSIASHGEEAFEMIDRNSYDFLIIDRMMPHIDGLSLVRMLHSRSKYIPFLFLTALGKQVDRIEGLSLGADDYLVKPFDLHELVLRIDNITRRSSPNRVLQEDKNISKHRGLIIDFLAYRITRDGYHIELSPKEYELFEVLFRNKGKVLDRDFLYEKVWGDYDASDKVLETINVHIAHLRKKLGGDIIRTVKLVGYVIDE